MMNTKRVLIAICMVGLLALSFWAGMYSSTPEVQVVIEERVVALPPEVVFVPSKPKIKYVEVHWSHPVEIVKEKEVEVIKEVKVEVPMENEDWDSLEELKDFLTEHEDEFFVQALAGKDGIFQFSGQCVGYAIGLREVAASYGKNLEIQCLSPSEYRRIFGKRKDTHHAVNMAIVGYELYYIEPEDRTVRLGGYIP